MRHLRQPYTQLLDHLPWWMRLAPVNVGICAVLYGVVGYFCLPGLPVGPAYAHRYVTAALLAIGGTGWYYAYGWAKVAPKSGQLRYTQQQIRVYATMLASLDGRFVATSGGEDIAVRRARRGMWTIALVPAGALAGRDNETSIPACGYVVHRAFGSVMCYTFRTDLTVARHDNGTALMMRMPLDRQQARGMSFRQMGLYLAASDYNEPSELATLAAQLRTAADACRTQAPDLSGAFARGPRQTISTVCGLP
jgi:hypothetical protein